jgi:hypothetical protein
VPTFEKKSKKTKKRNDAQQFEQPKKKARKDDWRQFFE